MSSEGIRREVAWRVYAEEYNDSDLSFKEGDDERAPNYVVTPSAAKVNRVFVVGVVTEVDEIGDDYYRVRVSDPTATYMVYAGQYQPDALSFFRDLDTPEFVSVVGKARTYQPEDSDDVYTSIRPEEVNLADAETRDRWNLETARHTIERTEAMLAYLKGDSQPYDNHRPRLHDADDTVEHYDLDEDYLEGLRKQSYQVVAELAGVDADLDDLDDVEVDASRAAEAETPAGATEEAAEAETPAGATEEAAEADATVAGGDDGDTEPASAEPERTEAAGASVDEESGDPGATAEAESAASETPAEAEGTADTGVSDDAAETSGDGASTDADTDGAAAGEADATTVDAGDSTSDAEADVADAAAEPASEPSINSGETSGDTSFEEEFDDVDSEEAEWEWDEGERERVEEEFGGEFDTAAELDSDDADTTEDAEEAVEPTDLSEAAEPDAQDTGATEASGEPEETAEQAEDADRTSEPTEDETDSGDAAAVEDDADDAAAVEDSGDAGDVDAESVVMEVIEENDSGEGVPRPEIKSLALERGVTEEDAEDALEQLLLEGMCYPSDGDSIKPL